MTERIYLIAYINTAADGSSDKSATITSNTGKQIMLKSHEVRASLQRSVPHLSRDHETIVRGLQADGICATGATDAINASAAPGGLRILSLHAAAEADPLKAHLVRRVMTMARSMGVTLNAESPIDPYALSAELKAAGASLNDRMQLKSALATLGCL